MLTSMTGFGRAEAALSPSGRVVAEIRSVNHRFLEMEIRVPEGFQVWEEALKSLVGRQLCRGQVRISIAIKRGETQPPVEFDLPQAGRYLKQLHRLEKGLNLTDAVTLQLLLGLPQVMKAADREHPSARQWPQVARAVEQALARLVRMRRQEGARLQKVLRAEIGTLRRLAAKAQQAAPEVYRQAQKRLAQRMETLLRNTAAPAISRSSVLAEAGVLAQAADVSEELARIDSHLSALSRAASASVSSPGRTIDFLAQELQREVNTLGTKLRDTTVVECVVAMKGQIEKLREQAANLE